MYSVVSPLRFGLSLIPAPASAASCDKTNPPASSASLLLHASGQDSLKLNAAPKPQFGRQFNYLGPFHGLNFFTDFNDGASDKEALLRFDDVLDFLTHTQKPVSRQLEHYRKTGRSAPPDYLDRLPARMEMAAEKPGRLHQQLMHFIEGRSTELSVKNFQDIPYGDIPYANLVIQRLAGTKNREIHVHVTDPGVGNVIDEHGRPAHNRSILITQNHGVLIGPNNGSLGLFAKTLAEEGDRPVLLRINLRQVRELERIRLRNPYYEIPDTFHARDVFAVVAAAIASGVDPHLLGDIDRQFRIQTTDFSKRFQEFPLEKGQHQTFQALRDRTFGNIKTNLVLSEDRAKMLVKQNAHFKISAEDDEKTEAITLPFKAFFSQVDEGQPLAYLGSTYSAKPGRRLVEMAINMDNISNRLNIDPGRTKSLKIERLS
jgi:S-adenosylmethionine hydrolase